MKPRLLQGVLRRARARWLRWRSGTRIRCTGPGHRIAIADALLSGVTIEIEGAGNQLVIDAEARIWGGRIKLHGRNLLCRISGYCQLRNPELTVEDEGSRLVLLESVSATRSRLLAGEGGLVQVGNDCMMSVDADVRNTDGHAVLDATTGARLNPAADVVLEDHVWLGIRSQVLKGVRVGTHSIVAAGCVVVKDVPAHAIVAGVPARTIRTDITWRRQRH